MSQRALLMVKLLNVLHAYSLAISQCAASHSEHICNVSYFIFARVIEKHLPKSYVSNSTNTQSSKILSTPVQSFTYDLLPPAKNWRDTMALAQQMQSSANCPPCKIGNGQYFWPPHKAILDIDIDSKHNQPDFMLMLSCWPFFQLQNVYTMKFFIKGNPHVKKNCRVAL